MALNMQKFLEAMLSLNASDLHLTAGSPPMYRINGDLRALDHPKLSPDDVHSLMLQVTPDAKRRVFEEIGTADFSFAIANHARYRLNIYHQRGSTALVARLVNNKILTVEELGLPPALEAIASAHRGLVLVTGVTGSGKSSTLAAMIRHINDTRRAHIITVEDPIEYLHQHNKSIVNQIELGADTRDLATALKHILRQDPDVILFGELRDRESVKTALAATETGHMVFATLHTTDARKTISRILNLFDADEEKLILQELSMHLKAVVSQRLVRRAETKGRVPAVEILVNTPIVQKLVAEGRVDDIEGAMKSGEEGMQTFAQSLVAHVQAGTVALEEALKYVEDEAAFRRNVRGMYSGGDRGGGILG